jgi:hypothetical protein
LVLKIDVTPIVSAVDASGCGAPVWLVVLSVSSPADGVVVVVSLGRFVDDHGYTSDLIAVVMTTPGGSHRARRRCGAGAACGWGAVPSASCRYVVVPISSAGPVCVQSGGRA